MTCLIKMLNFFHKTTISVAATFCQKLMEKRKREAKPQKFDNQEQSRGGQEKLGISRFLDGWINLF